MGEEKLPTTEECQEAYVKFLVRTKIAEYMTNIFGELAPHMAVSLSTGYTSPFDDADPSEQLIKLKNAIAQYVGNGSVSETEAKVQEILDSCKPQADSMFRGFLRANGLPNRTFEKAIA